MRKLVFRLFLFWLPIALISFAIYGTGYYIGETMPLEIVVSTQQNSDEQIAFLPVWQQADYVRYKLLGAEAAQPDILVFGSSRMLYYTDDFLVDGVLYNASVSGTAINNQLDMLNILIETGTIPAVLLLGIDLETYNGEQALSDASQSLVISRNSSTNYQASSFLDVFGLWFSGEMPTLIDQSRSDNGDVFLGTRAILTQSGLVRDGSTYISSINPSRIADNITRLQTVYANQGDHYAYGTSLNEETFGYLTTFLDLAQSNNITVIGLTQPFHPYFADAMRDNPNYAYRPLAENAIESLFASYNFPYFAFPDIESYNGSADDFLDDWHYHQLAALKILTLIASQSQDILGDYVDVERLEQDIARTTNPYAVYYPAP